MALQVSDAGFPDEQKIRFNLQNETDIEIVFLIGKKSFTLKPGQSKNIRAARETSIEARPLLIGVESGFLAGGVKNDCTLSCSLASNGEATQALSLNKR